MELWVLKLKAQQPVSLFRQGKGFINRSTTSTWVRYSENPPQLLLYTSHPWISKQVRTGDKIHFRDREAKSNVVTRLPHKNPRGVTDRALSETRLRLQSQCSSPGRSAPSQALEQPSHSYL